MSIEQRKAVSVQRLARFRHDAPLDQLIPIELVHIVLLKCAESGLAFLLHPKRMVEIDQRAALFSNPAADLQHHDPRHAVGQAVFDGIIQQVFDFVGQFRLQFQFI